MLMVRQNFNPFYAITILKLWVHFCEVKHERRLYKNPSNERTKGII